MVYLLYRRYGLEVDWWTIGTLLFEMLTGLPPFYDENVQEMYQKILHQPLAFPPEVCPHVCRITHYFPKYNT